MEVQVVQTPAEGLGISLVGDGGDLIDKSSRCSKESTKKDSKPTRRRYEEAFDEQEDDDIEELDEPYEVPQDKEQVDLIGNQGKDVEMAVDAAVLEKVSIVCQLPSCPMVFSSAKEYQKHYNSRHMHACGICRKSLPSAYILEMHVLELHDTLFSLMAERKPMFQCFLETCVEKFENPEQRKVHCMSIHHFPEKFRFWQTHLSSSSSNNNSKSGKQNERKPRQKNSTNSSAKPEPEAIIEDANIDPSSSGNATEGLLPDIVLESDLSTKQNNVSSSQGKGCISNNFKPKPMHIAFGHAPHQMFKKNHTFGLPKTGKSGKQGKSNSNPNGTDTEMDLSEIQDALKATSTSAIVLGLVGPTQKL